MVPRHVAVILDGNGRWAQNRGFSREKGHLAGAANVPNVIRALFDRGVGHITFYALSEDNLSRPEAEVNGILGCIVRFKKDFPALFPGVRLGVIGDVGALPEPFRSELLDMEGQQNNKMCKSVDLLVNYGGRGEIIRAARLLQERGFEGDWEAEMTKIIGRSLPDPDLVIRTGGEKRLSGFMPWSTVWSELYFTDVLFPDFGEDDVAAALADFEKRSRRFGGIETKDSKTP